MEYDSMRLDGEKDALEMVMNYKAVFKSEGSKAVLADLAKRCHFTDSTLPRAADALEMARREGHRETFVYILGRLEASLDDRIEIIKSLNKRLENNKIKHSGGIEDEYFSNSIKSD